LFETVAEIVGGGGEWISSNIERTAGRNVGLGVCPSNEPIKKIEMESREQKR
jgi:hypothetical protein